ncbi:MAG: hypothetical protein LLG00_10845 [Planctomycetaceae bacterium]|nr:hypothetical protein [Planctomycetaceae bacterium]
MTHITFDPYIPLALWVPLALATAGLLAWYSVAGRRLPDRRWWAVVTLMALAAAVPLLVLLNPTWMEQIPPPPGKPLLTVLVDRSASMATRDAPGGKTRFQVGAALATATAEQLKDQYEVRLRWFAAASVPCSPETLTSLSPDGLATDLAVAVQGALEEDRPQGQAILLLSDGIHNAGGSDSLRQAAFKARAMAVPIYTKTLGTATVVNDLEVTVRQPQELAFADQRVPVIVMIRQRGKLAVRTKLSLHLGDKQVESRDVPIKPDDAVEETFYVSHKQSGLYRYEVRAAVLPGEATAANNSAPMLLRVIDQPVRMLLLEGKPYWDTKFLVRTLSADPSVELTSVVQLAENRFLRRKIPRHIPQPQTTPATKSPVTAVAATKPAPSSAKTPSPPAKNKDLPVDDGEKWTIETDPTKLLADDLASYQIVVLGRNTEVFLTDDALAKLRKWLVEAEGSLVCFRGAPTSQINQRLGELMPVRWTPTAEVHYNMQLTGTAQALHWLPVGRDGLNPLAELPPLAAAARPETAQALSVVLATGVVDASGKPAPVISYQPVGSGRSVAVEGAGMWRWAFLPPERQKQEEIYGSLWQSLVRWLVAQVGLLPSQRLALRTDSISLNTDESVSATLLTRDWKGDPPQVELIGGTLAGPRSFTCIPHGAYPGQYHVAVGRLDEGKYTLRMRGVDARDPSSATAFEVRQSTAERLDVRTQPAAMAMIARDSGGTALETVEPRLLAHEFHDYLTRTRPQRTARTMAWDRWWALSGALLLWATAWGLRRRSGLI